eukprot:27172-Chlamydomonas_euryale.AAC.1
MVSTIPEQHGHLLFGPHARAALHNCQDDLSCKVLHVTGGLRRAVRAKERGGAKADVGKNDLASVDAASMDAWMNVWTWWRGEEAVMGHVLVALMEHVLVARMEHVLVALMGHVLVAGS